MVFSSIEFIIFFAVVLFVTLILQSKNLNRRFDKKTIHIVRNIFLLIASYIFYGWWDFRFCALMALMTLVAYWCSYNIDKGNKTKLFTFIGVAVPLFVLGIFKYFNFFMDSFYSLFSIDKTSTLNIILPVGISFYTFQSMSYTIDVIRKKIKSHSLLDVALYISFFPQLVAGPIVKAADFIPQLYEDRELNRENFLKGLQIFLFGLFKKIVISDYLSVFVDDVFSNPVIFSSGTIVLAVISYSIQIYFDFSGYSDMAIGAAKCLGFDFKRNFNIPYISKNVSEFWKRWHISLSEWLQEYLYIPLGGNRKGTVRTYINLLVTMVLGGLWHGANVTFIVWGTLHGLALCVHKIFKKYCVKDSRGNFLTNGLSILLTYIFVCICWIFFRAEDVSAALIILKKILSWTPGVVQVYSWSVIAIVILIIGELVAWFVSKKNQEKKVSGFYPLMDLSKFWALTALFIFIGLIIGLAYTGANPFIYFQF